MQSECISLVSSVWYGFSFSLTQLDSWLVGSPAQNIYTVR